MLPQSRFLLKRAEMIPKKTGMAHVKLTNHLIHLCFEFIARLGVKNASTMRIGDLLSVHTIHRRTIELVPHGENGLAKDPFANLSIHVVVAHRFI